MVNTWISSSPRRAGATLVPFVARAVSAGTADIPNRHGPLRTAGQPTAVNLEAAAKAGYKSVIDLKAPVEERGFDERMTVERCAPANRAGALLALRARRNDADSAAALELGIASGLTGLKPTVKKKLAEWPR
jgi:hypothetical protein